MSFCKLPWVKRIINRTQNYAQRNDLPIIGLVLYFLPGKEDQRHSRKTSSSSAPRAGRASSRSEISPPPLTSSPRRRTGGPARTSSSRGGDGRQVRRPRAGEARPRSPPRHRSSARTGWSGWFGSPARTRSPNRNRTPTRDSSSVRARRSNTESSKRAVFRNRRDTAEPYEQYVTPPRRHSEKLMQRTPAGEEEDMFAETPGGNAE